jgi:hypothetical protein
VESCATCTPWLEKAVSLYRADFLAGFSLRDSPGFDEWQFLTGEELRRRYAFALEKLARRASWSADHEKAIAYARKWVALDPLVEDAQRELMRCYALAGQRNAALRQYQDCARVLEKELGVAPLEETQRLYFEIQRNQLTPPPQSGSAPGPDTALPSTDQREALPVLRFPLVGRSPETESLLRAYNKGAGRGYFFSLQGEAGIGKTRLAEEFTRWARQQGATVLSARCFEGETNLAFAPFAEALTAALGESGGSDRLQGLPEEWVNEAARLLPSLRSGAHALFDQNVTIYAQSKFFEGLRQVLLRLAASQPPGVLFLDDLQWADPASLDFLAYIVRRLPGQPLFILASWRDEDLAAQARLRQILAEALRAGYADNLYLTRLKQADVDDLARLVARHDQGLPGDFTDCLYRESEGLPYFLVEYLDALLVSKSESSGFDESRLTPHGDW